MVIGIDGNEANVGKKVGVSEYAFQLILEFYKKRKSDLQFTIFLKEKPKEFLPQEDAFWQYAVIGPKKFWTQIGLPFYLFTHKTPSLFFTPTHYAPRFCPVSSVVSIMDLSYLYFPDLFKKSDLLQLRSWTAYSVQKARQVFTISKASKNDIIKEYKLPSEKVVVTYPGIKQQKDKMSPYKKVQEMYKVKEKFILFVGTLQPRKNIERLIHAFSLLKDNNLQLVIVGKKGWLYEEILSAPEKYHVQDRVLFLGFVEDDVLSLLYAHAICFVLPSLYEGFGLPILEAMKYGCPVLTSNVSSLPEAGGNAALYCSPTDVEDIAQKLDTIISNESLRDTMIKKGYEHIKKFTWEQTAKETLKVLEQIANEK